MKKIIYRLLITIKKRYYGLVYRPQGYSIRVEDSATLKILHGGYSISNTKEPFYLQLNENLFKEASFEMKEVRIGRIEKGRVLTNLRNAIAVIDNDKLIIGEYSFSYEKNIYGYFHHAHVSENYFLKEKKLDAPFKVQGIVFSMLTGGGKNFNFYHWFFDVLSRVVDLKESGWFGEVDYFLVPEYEQHFQKESLEFLGIKQDKIISSVNYKHVYADCIIASSHPRTATYSVRSSHALELQRLFSSSAQLKIDSSKHYPSKFFISRSDAPRRRILNEKQLSQNLLDNEIYTIKISDYTFQECIHLFRNANWVISTHSAALTNIVFSKHTTKIFEIFEQNAALPYYYELAKSLQMEYVPIILNSEKKIPDSRYEIQKSDIQIDIERVLQIINPSRV